MTNIVEEIHYIRSLRKELRDPKLTPTNYAAIENIHNCIKNTEASGWKKVEWRSKPGNSNKNRSGNTGNTHNTHNTSNIRNTRNVFENKNKLNPNESPISIPLTSNIDGIRNQKYVSKFKKTDDVENTILNTIILGKLNKFSMQNYNEVKEFITHIIDNGETEMIKCFMKLVFEKAACEEMFCPLYAKLLSELSSSYPILLTEMDNLYSQYMIIFEEVTENTTDNYNDFCKRNVENKYRRGYSQFLAELIKHNVIEIDLFIKTINKIICQIENNSKNVDSIKLNEEYSDCLMKITKAIQTNTDGPITQKMKHIRNVLKSEVLLRIQPFSLRNSENIGMSSKARFTILDMYEGIQKF